VPKPAPKPTIDFDPPAIDALKETVAGQGAKAKLTIKTTGMDEVGWVVVRSDWKWRNPTPTRVPTTGTVEIEPTLHASGDFVKALKPDDYSINRDTPPVAVIPAPVPAQPLTGAMDRVRKVIAPWRIGVNVERAKFLEEGHLTDAVLRQCAAAGVTHIRLFIPSGGRYALWDANNLGLYLDACKRIIAHGMAVHIDLNDVLGVEHLTDGLFNNTRACARKFREQNYDTSKFLIGGVNEYAGGDHAAYEGQRIRLDDMLHAEFPHHVVVTNGAYWGDPDVLMKGGFRVRADRPQLIQWHKYEPNGLASENPVWWQGRLDAWAKQNGCVTYCGEWGYGLPDNSDGKAVDYKSFPAVITNVARGLGQQRPALWTITTGGWWRVNGWDANTPFLRPEVEAAVKEASAHIAGQAWYRSGLAQSDEPAADAPAV
jgi:hypothetical protein